MLEFVIFPLAVGLARAVRGAVKNYRTGGKWKFDPKFFGGSIVGAIVVGMLAGFGLDAVSTLDITSTILAHLGFSWFGGDMFDKLFEK